jgi:type IV secretion system protein VirD4
MNRRLEGADLAIVCLVGLFAVSVVEFWALNIVSVAGANTPVVLHLGEMPQVLVAFLTSPLDPAARWPFHLHGLAASPGVLWLSWLLSAAVGFAVARFVERIFGVSLTGFLHGPSHGATWATPRDLAPLIVPRPQRGRLTLGRYKRQLLAAEPGQSVAVIGPTQSGKSSGFAIPAMLEWDGPVIATSVKRDLVDVTRAAREQYGRVWIYDPGAPDCCAWSPTDLIDGTWRNAQRLADWMIRSADATPGKEGEGNFWSQAAVKFLAPLLYAASLRGGGLQTMMRWIERREWREVGMTLAECESSVGRETIYAQASATGTEVAEIDTTSDDELPLNAWLAAIEHDERFLSSVVATVEAALVSLGDPAVLERSMTRGFTPRDLLTGSNTLYVCAPLQEQERLKPLFTALVRSVFAAAYDRYAATGKRLKRPLLAVLDEAGNIAPVPDLARIASTGVGVGVQVVSIWHDLAQLQKTYGSDGAETVLNNHRARLILPGIADEKTLLWVEKVLGNEEVWRRGYGFSSKDRNQSESLVDRLLAPGHSVRELGEMTGLLVYGRIPPAKIDLRPWFKDRALQALQRGENIRARKKPVQGNRPALPARTDGWTAG